MTMLDTVNMNRNETDFEVEVEFSIYGEYHRETWGFDGGCPEEFPEVEIVKVRPINTKTGKMRAKPIRLTRDERERLEGILLGNVDRRNQDMADDARISAHEARMNYDGEY